MIGRGMLRHIFHGTAEAARLILAFDTHEAAAAALAIVGAPFTIVSKDPRCLYATLSADELRAFKETHATADRVTFLPCSYKHCHPRAKSAEGPCKAHAIDALTHSVDVGPPFAINLGTVTPPEAARKPRKRTPRKASPATHNACTVERRALVKHESLSLGTGEIAPSGQAWETKACGTPLFSGTPEAARGVCRSCFEGWTHPENYATATGEATIERARNTAATAAGKRGVVLPPKGSAARKDLALASDRDAAASKVRP